MEVSRRTLAVAGVGFAATMALGGAARAFAGEGSLLRPPGGQDEARFIGSCIHCDRCRSVCPQGVIVTGKLEDGLLNVGTPRLDFRRGICDFCGKCIGVCPTAALEPFDKDCERLGVAVVQRDQCLAWGASSCRVCIDACPYQAIEAGENGAPAVLVDRCNGCGVCEFVCPSGTYRSYSGTGLRGINVQKGGEDAR